VPQHEKIYLTTALEYFEYMKIPLALFPAWTIEQYYLNKIVLDGWVYTKNEKSSMGLTTGRHSCQ
jgi:hypothetical protein